MGKIEELLKDKYKLRIPPTVYYELLADVQELEEEEESTTKNNLGVDAVSRQAVIDLMMQKWGENFSGDDAMQESIDAIREMSSVTPQPRKGHWITKPHVYGVTYCSECDFELKIDNTNYCPNCGTKMAESEE